MSDELVTCPTCNGKGATTYSSRNPGSGRTFNATKSCDTCKGKRRIHPSEYPEHLRTPMSANTNASKETDAYDTPTSIIQKYEPDFTAVLPSHIKPETWVRLTTSVFRTNKDLAKILLGNPGSVLAALLDAARLGLEPGDTYHLVPFGGEVVGIADYTGLIELMYRAGAVASVKAELVYEKDRFHFTTDMQRPVHEPDWFAADRGKIIGAYAYADMINGAVSRVIVRSKTEIDKVRNVSKLKNGIPWTQWYDRMALKTVVRELEKFVPTSPEWRREQLRAVMDMDGERVPVSFPPAGVDKVTGEVLDAELEPDDGRPEVAEPGQQ
jgi:recombination protein RecT